MAAYLSSDVQKRGCFNTSCALNLQIRRQSNSEERNVKSNTQSVDSHRQSNSKERNVKSKTKILANMNSQKQRQKLRSMSLLGGVRAVKTQKISMDKIVDAAKRKNLEVLPGMDATPTAFFNILLVPWVYSWGAGWG